MREPAAVRHAPVVRRGAAVEPGQERVRGRPAWARAWLISASTWSAAVCWWAAPWSPRDWGWATRQPAVRRGWCLRAARLGSADGDGLGEAVLAGLVALGLAALAAGLGLGCAGPLLLRPSRRTRRPRSGTSQRQSRREISRNPQSTPKLGRRRVARCCAAGRIRIRPPHSGHSRHFRSIKVRPDMRTRGLACGDGQMGAAGWTNGAAAGRDGSAGGRMARGTTPGPGAAGGPRGYGGAGVDGAARRWLARRDRPGPVDLF